MNRKIKLQTYRCVFTNNMYLHVCVFQMILYFGNAVASFLLSFFISLTFEAPVVNLLKIMLMPPQVKKTSTDKNSSELQDS